MNNLYPPYPATAINPTPPKVPTVAKTPVAPRDCIPANTDPATTLPMLACAPAAIVPAAIPDEVKPAAVNPPPTTVAVPLAIPVPIATLLLVYDIIKNF